ncbi:hypothetical protein EV127DRAFT_87044 [Xylaria flabelliformis]|nr:hypothetical protein EV127DRAFT_87044 [Xylaria flabelliformis]KAI0859448.1 hypothetical protein F4860DRAFT_254415 [Xylaria cubensis]
MIPSSTILYNTYNITQQTSEVTKHSCNVARNLTQPLHMPTVASSHTFVMPTTRPAATQYSSASSSSSSVSDASFRLSMDARPVASVEVLRCLRCHRHVETTSTDDLASTGMIRVGFNLYYCTKCAAAVGYK